MANENSFSGGCKCRANRFSISSSPAMIAYCHCDDCRTSSGGAAAVLAGFARDGFVSECESAKGYSQVPGVTRSFCGTCGTRGACGSTVTSAVICRQVGHHSTERGGSWVLRNSNQCCYCYQSCECGELSVNHHSQQYPSKRCRLLRLLSMSPESSGGR